MTTIGVAIKAGARNEGYDNAGVTHALRVASGMATTKNTAFGMCRNLQQVSNNIFVRDLTDLTLRSQNSSAHSTTLIRFPIDVNQVTISRSEAL